MILPSRSDTLVSISFVFVGLIYALCDRWQMELTVQGVVTRKPHKFDHLFVMWTLRMILQLGLFFLWKTIKNNWFGFAIFRHGEKDKKGNVNAALLLAENVNEREQELQFPGENVNGNEQNIGQFFEEIVNANEQNIGPFNEENGNAREQHIQAENADPDEQEVNDNQYVIEHLDDGGNQERADNNAVEHPHEEVVKIKRKTKKPSKLIYFPPAFFAMAHVLLRYFGLKLTYSSSFIMLKGTVAFFTALLSLAFLSQPIACFVWFGVVTATLGFGVSGISDYINVPNPGYEKYGIAAGDLLILMSQIMFATKIIYEEKFIQKHSIHPMLFLGCEGMYGSFFSITFLLIFNFVDSVQYSNLPNGRLEDVHDFMFQFANSWRVMLAVLGSLASYIVYTYLGMFLIRDKGALHRIMIETFVWSIYWAVCLALHWENYFIVQIPGLCVITIGALIFLILPLFPYFQKPVNNEQDFMDNTLEDREDNQDLQEEQDGPEAGDLLQGQDGPEAGELLLGDDIFGHDDNVPLLAEAQEYEADALRRRARETV